MNREFIDYLNDIVSEIQQIESFVKGYSLKEFSNDVKTYYAVIRALEVIGEASGKIPQEIKQQYPEIPWKEIYGMRNKLIHDYFGVDEEVIWQTIANDLPPLKNSIVSIIMNYKPS